MNADSGILPTRRRHRRAWFIASVLTLVVILAIGGAVYLLWWQKDGREAEARQAWTPPAQSLLTSPMSVRPVPGWTLRAADLGLPEGSRFASDELLRQSRAFVGHVDNRGYFLSMSAGSVEPQWWLLGVDVLAGKRLFAPVPLNEGPRGPKCYLNGPEALLCVRDDAAADVPVVWVIDGVSGAVTHTGPTELRTAPGILGVQQVGQYAVAATLDQGVYGLGPRAETTWFVPGRGKMPRRTIDVTDVAPQTLATEEVGGDRSEVFSVVDGSVVTPDVSAGQRPMTAAVYPGGFAIEVVADGPRSTPDGLEFFDVQGRRLGAVDGLGFLSPDPAALPIFGGVVYGSSGQKLADTSGLAPGNTSVLMGTRLLIDGPANSASTDQYDLRTGAKGKNCPVRLGGYRASDGQVGVFDVSIPNDGLVTQGMDLTTCDVLWNISSPVGSFRDIWRVNTTLVQLSDDGTELTSLVAPS